MEIISPLEVHYQHLLDAVADVVFGVDEQGCFNTLNRAWQDYTGYSLLESLGKPVQAFMSNDDFHRWQDCSVSGAIQGEFRFLDNAGRAVWFKVNCTLLNGNWYGTLINIDERRQAAMAPFTHEQQCRIVVESLAEILFQVDQQFRIVFLNPAWMEITGFRIAESHGHCLLDFVASPDIKHSLQLWASQPWKHSPYRQDFRLKCKNMPERWMSMLLHGVISGEGEWLITGAMLDIHQRKVMEETLRQSKERYAFLSSISTDGVWDWDLATDQVYFSPRWKAMIGYDDHELDNTFATWYDRVHPDDIDAAMCDVRACLAGDKPLYENVHRMHHKEGKWVWIFDRGAVLRDENGRPYRMLGSHADITRLKIAEQTLQRRERELEAVVGISPDGIVTIAPQGTVQSANPAFLAMTGFDLNKLIGLSEQEFERSLLEISSLKPGSRFKANLDNQVYFIDLKKLRGHKMRCKSGYNKPKQANSPKLRVLSRADRYLQSDEVAKVMYFRDISIENEVDQMKSEFLSTAAHELRTPMSSVFGFSELLLSRGFDADVQREILTTIHQQADSLVRMLNQLLDLARIESRMGLDFCFERQTLWPLIERTADELMLPGDSRKVTLKYPKRDYLVEVDADKICQVVRNVLANAFKYSPNGAAVTLEIKERRHQDDEVEVGIVIRDRGLGMSADQIKRVFERFWRADNSSEIAGTGLGMSLVKDIMDIHQGKVEIKSELGAGTTVRLWLKQSLNSENEHHE